MTTKQLQLLRDAENRLHRALDNDQQNPHDIFEEDFDRIVRPIHSRIKRVLDAIDSGEF